MENQSFHHLIPKEEIWDMAEGIAKNHFNLAGKIESLPGEIDANFKITTDTTTYLLKLSKPGLNVDFHHFQVDLLGYISQFNFPNYPQIQSNKKGEPLTFFKDKEGHEFVAKLYSWIDGRLWSSINPKKDNLLFDLGKQAGTLTALLKGFNHSFAFRELEWDLAKAHWVNNYINLFTPSQQETLLYFLKKYNDFQSGYRNLRKAVVHNDVNDNNIMVSFDLVNPKVIGIIDFGDAVHTQIVNDVAIVIAYASMGKPDPLSAATKVLKGYHRAFPLKEEELEYLFALVGMRLVISITKSAINRKKEPGNEYLFISEKPAWSLLEDWKLLNQQFVLYTFREVCGFDPHPNSEEFKLWANTNSVSLNQLFPTINFKSACLLDLSVSSTWLGGEAVYNNNSVFNLKLKGFKQENLDTIPAGGYLETRPLYCTEAYKKEGNNGPEYRSVHLGMDFWVDKHTPVHAPFDGIVYSVFNNNKNKDYGPTIILKHKTEKDILFYSLYGHLSISSISLHASGDKIKKGELVGYVGPWPENGNWVPHLHFQLMLDMLGNRFDFPGVCFPNQVNTWKSICPDPNGLLKQQTLIGKNSKTGETIEEYRKQHLGKNLSLSYDKPLHIVRGEGVFLLDKEGRKYLDTVNNVAHVGHEHPEVVRAGQDQMGLLNTNTRYLHQNITDFAVELLSTFPKELAVVHFVNSGSEANELALRMVKTFTKRKGMIVMEHGYHGNTSGCIELSSYKFNGKGGEGAREYIHVVPLPDLYRGIYQEKDAVEKYVWHVQEKIQHIQLEQRGLAGFIAESIVGCGGQIELPAGYLNKVYDLVKEAGGLCIADEVQTGCGRVGNNFWAFEGHGVMPDIVTIGKPLGNGHPLGAVVCTREVAEGFNNGMEYFNTFGGNSVSCAIGLEVLKVIKREDLQTNALEIGGYLKIELHKLQREFSILGDIRGQGLFLGIELTDKQKRPLPQKTKYLTERMKELGILMSIDGKDNNVLKIKPPLVFSQKNANELLYRLKLVLEEDFMLIE